LEKYSRENFLVNGLSIVLKGLEEFPRRKQYDESPRSALDLMSAGAKRKFFLSHRFVLISIAADGRLRFGPMRHKVPGKSAVSAPGGEQYARTNITPGEFLSVLEQAFSFAD
jgi:hypothetical protein